MRRALIILLVTSIIPACSPKVPSLTSETEANMIANLRNGRTELQCGTPCGETWRRNLSELNSRYAKRDWLHLASLVAQIGYQNDLAYYYLGQSADGLGAPSAALRYYQTAGALAARADPRVKCNSAGHDDCNGLSFPRDLYLPMQIAQKRDASLRTAQTNLRIDKQSTPAPRIEQAPAGTEGDGPAPAHGEDWIDPPPVTQ